MFKRAIFGLMFLSMVCIGAAPAHSDVYVRGHYRYNGTYVQSHYRSNPDTSFYNNWSTHPNVNPYTGSIGTRRTPSYRSRSYSAPRTTTTSSWLNFWK